MNVFSSVLIVANVWPEPTSSAAGTRMMQLIQFFKEQGSKITFASTAHPSDFVADLDAIGLNSVSILVNSDTFDDLLEDVKPTLVLFDRFVAEEQFGWRVMKHCPEALRVLNTEDLHFLRDARRLATKKAETIDLNDRSSLETEKSIREISSIYRSDVSLMVSETEMNLLNSTFEVPEHLLHYLPLFSGAKTEDSPSFEERSGFVFIGNFRHEPNWDSIRLIKEEIWPLIRTELPKAVINVYGAYISPKVMNLHNEKDGFIIHGRAKNSEEVNQNARVSLSPLRFGAGIKGKLMEAMRTGTPNVTTSIGAEDMTLNDKWSGIIADSNEAIASAAVQLYNDQESWSASQKIGYNIISNRYNSTLYTVSFKEQTESIASNLSTHRNKSFTSKLMQQQSVMSSHYMSLWIMEKDKNATEES